MVIRSSRQKIGLYLVACVAFVLGALWMRRDPSAPQFVVWLGLVFFGLGGVVFALQLVWPPRLLCDAAGFRNAPALTRRTRERIAWQDIEGFYVYIVNRRYGTKAVGYRYAPGARPPSPLRSLTKRLGADGGVAVTPSFSLEELVEKLNAYRARAIACQSTQGDPAPAEDLPCKRA